MRLKDTTLDEFVYTVKRKNLKIVVYGAGVIGKVTLPAFIENRGLDDRVLLVVDANCYKHGETIKIGDRGIEIVSPERLNNLKENFVILISGSRYDSILRYLDKMEKISLIDVYIFPQMLVKECRYFAKQETKKRSKQSMIPKVIHYCWFGGKELPDQLKKCKESWSRFCPDYLIIEWSENNYDIEKHVYTSQAYKHKKWGFIPDIARLEILYRYGGIYMDTDVELIRALDDLLYQPGFVGVEKWGVINIGGCCGVIPKHPVIRKILEYRLSIPFEYEDGSLNLESSGYYESKPLLDCGFKPDNKIQIVEDMAIYSSDFFHPFDYMSRELCITENTYGIHHFMGSWVE